MDKKTLQNILGKAFNLSNWTGVLREVFGAEQIYAQPRQILLKSTDKATEAYELGKFTTTDDRLIGLYRVVLTPKVWLERNKVGLRQLLRSVYKYDVDGAIIVFDQGERWRLSFVSEIKALDDEGQVIEYATEPKRYTYLLGKDEKVRTPVDRLSKLAGQALALEDIREAFSVEALNNEFYRIVAEHFYQLLGGTVKGKGKKTQDYGEGILRLPGVPKENTRVYQEFAVRLIGRTVFAWFLKVKKSDKGTSLLPESLLSSDAVKNNSGYYHSILERLFFQTLNTPIDKRPDNLPKGCEQIPFLNGGLFEPDNEDYYRPDNFTGLSEHINTLKIPDEWFLSFFTELEKYNFTIDENSTVDIEVSVDPEMLGRIFENLLAEIDPDSGETARKATGSFYTPREIVDYMTIESLTQYMHNKTGIDTGRLRPVFKLTEKALDFTQAEIEKTLDALEQIKVLDPACGSGAFPMGVLHKIVTALQKLDPNAQWWKKRQIDRIENPIVKRALKEKLDSATVEYAQKLGIIQNSLYGVDIQPIAAEISKLRAFLTLIVDENIDENRPNLGIEPLPNLEFKFVTANTLIKLPEERKDAQQIELFGSLRETEQLQKLRNHYLQSYGEEKEEIKHRFLELQTQVFEYQLKNNVGQTETRAFKLSTWDPFSHQGAAWFDPEWMFGVKEFDVVIGNPPYISAVSMARTKKQKKILKKIYPLVTGSYDIYILFLLKTIELTKKDGVFSWIIPNKFLAADYAFKTKEFLIRNGLYQCVDVSTFNVFKTTNVYPIIIIGNKRKTNGQCTEYSLKKYSDLDSNNLYSDKQLPDFNTFKQFGLRIASGATGFDAQKIKKILTENPNEKEIIPFTVSGCIDRYTYSNKNVRYMKSYYKVAYIVKSNIMAKSKWELWCNPKIVIAGMTKIIESVYVTQPLALGVGVYAIYDFNGFNPKFLTIIMNSKFLSYYLINKFKHKHLAGGYLAINKSTIEKLPLVHTDNQLVFSVLYDYLIFLKSTEEPINAHVPNSYIAEVFEEVIDAMVMELYFEEEFHKADLEFIRYAGRDFKPMEDLKTKEKKTAVIHEAYQKLRQKDNEIRNNLKLMDIKLPDITGPIKGAGK